MAHYAFLDQNNVVVDIIFGIDENELIEGLDPETWYGNFKGLKCVRTSRNGKIRKNAAAIGGTYDENNDAFIPPKPYPSWILDQDTYQWKAPTPYPSTITNPPVSEEMFYMATADDGYRYDWSEEELQWKKVIL